MRLEHTASLRKPYVIDDSWDGPIAPYDSTDHHNYIFLTQYLSKLYLKPEEGIMFEFYMPTIQFSLPGMIKSKHSITTVMPMERMDALTLAFAQLYRPGRFTPRKTVTAGSIPSQVGLLLNQSAHERLEAAQSLRNMAPDLPVSIDEINRVIRTLTQA
jgi:hypothetical protein